METDASYSYREFISTYNHIKSNCGELYWFDIFCRDICLRSINPKTNLMAFDRLSNFFYPRIIHVHYKCFVLGETLNELRLCSQNAFLSHRSRSCRAQLQLHCGLL